MHELAEVAKMGSREIAQLTGKNHRDVTRDIDKLNKSYEDMGMVKVAHTLYKHPQNGQMYREYTLTKMQTFDLLTGYNVKLRIKVNRRWEEMEGYKKLLLSDPIISIRVNQIEMQRDISENKQHIKEIEAKITTRPEYFAISGFATLKGISVPLRKAAVLGRKASRICNTRGIEIEKITDPRYGLVGVYPASVLEEIFLTEYPVLMEAS